MFTHGRRIGARRIVIVFPALSLVLGLAMAGCSANRSDVRVESNSFSAPDLIERCAAVYSNAESVRARGRLMKHGASDVGTRLVAWDYSRPGKTRIRVDERVAVIRDGVWFHYDPTRDVYRRHPGLGGDPIQTAVYFLTDGAPMPEIAMPMAGVAALGGGDASDWRLSGVKWVSERPCYVLRHPYSADRGDLEMAIWIDQETNLFRGWAVQPIDADMDDSPLVWCEYDAIVLNAPIAEDQFAIGTDRDRVIARAVLREP